MKQMTFADAEYAGKRKQTRKELFLIEMDQVVPWKGLIALIEPHYPKGEGGRPAYPLMAMLRIHLMQNWFYGKYGEEVYTDLKSHTEAIEIHLEHEEIALSPKNRKALLSESAWREQREIMHAAQRLAEKIGSGEFLDFNRFECIVDETLKQLGLKLPAPVRKQILNAVSWRDERAEKVIKKILKLNAAKLAELLAELNTTQDKLADYGYWPNDKGEYIEYEPDSELRDTENVPLALDSSLAASGVIHDYFIREVRPHVDEAWIAIGKTVIGYEISFNKYFYQHKPLRSLEEVTAEILKLEAETDGLLKQLVSFVSEAKQ